MYDHYDYSYEEPIAPPRRKRSESSSRSIESNRSHNDRDERFSDFPNRLQRHFSTELLPVMNPLETSNPYQSQQNKYNSNQMNHNYGQLIGQPLIRPSLQPMWRPINTGLNSLNQTQVLIPNFVVQNQMNQSSRIPTPIRQTFETPNRGRDPTPKWTTRQLTGSQLSQNYRENMNLYLGQHNSPEMIEKINMNMNLEQRRRQISPSSQIRTNKKSAPQRPPPPNLYQPFNEGFNPNVYNCNERLNKRSVSPTPMGSRYLMPNSLMVNQSSVQINSNQPLMQSYSGNLMPNSSSNIRRSASLVTPRNLMPNQMMNIQRSSSPINTRNLVSSAMNPISNKNTINPIESYQRNVASFPQQINTNNFSNNSLSPKTNTNLLLLPEMNRSLSSNSINKINRRSPSPIRQITTNQNLSPNRDTRSSRKELFYGNPPNNETFSDHFDQYRSSINQMSNNKTNRFSEDFEDMNLSFESNTSTSFDRKSNTLPKPIDNNIILKDSDNSKLNIDNISDKSEFKPSLVTPIRKMSSGQRKTSLPTDYSIQNAPSEEWSREKVSSLSHSARIKSHEKPVNINISKVGSWFTRQLLILLVSSINILFAFLFYQLFQMLPKDE